MKRSTRAGAHSPGSDLRSPLDPITSTVWTRRRFLGGAAAGLLAARLAALRPVVASSSPATADQFDAEVPLAWFDLAGMLVQETAGFSPPVASRAFAYAALALYEALVPGMPSRGSLAGRLPGLTELPQAGRNAGYHWPTVANAGLASILRSLFPTAPPASRAAVTQLEESFNSRFGAELPPGVFGRSVDRGREVAGAIFDWSRSDGGHEGYLRNFPPGYVPPVGPGRWTPTPPQFLPALQPFWGRNRAFAAESGADCAASDHPAYSESRRSQFFEDAVDVYDAVNDLTEEQEAIARFWSDDPGQTSTPPGHSISILTQVLRRGSALDLAAEAYARVGMAVADAFICCWFTKYEDNLLRPVTYIQDRIDRKWMPLLTTPPFPEYTSGHSVQSGAAAQVMTDLFGDLAFTDHTHDALGLAPRTFGSFFEAADEAAISRLYGGIHYRPAIDEGVEQGRCVGLEVSALDFGA